MGVVRIQGYLCGSTGSSSCPSGTHEGASWSKCCDNGNDRNPESKMVEYMDCCATTSAVAIATRGPSCFAQFQRYGRLVRRRRNSMAAPMLGSVIPVAVAPIILVNEYSPGRLVQANSKWKVLDQHRNTGWRTRLGTSSLLLGAACSFSAAIAYLFPESSLGIVDHCL